MERHLVKVTETQTDLLLSGFRMVYAETLRNDLEPKHREYVNETLDAIATNAVDQGLGKKLAEIKEEVDYEHKLTVLKRSWVDGEIAL